MTTVIPFSVLEEQIKSSAETPDAAKLLLRVLAWARKNREDLADVEGEVDDKATSDLVKAKFTEQDKRLDRQGEQLHEHGNAITARVSTADARRLLEGILKPKLEALGETNGPDWAIRGKRLEAVETKADEVARAAVRHNRRLKYLEDEVEAKFDKRLAKLEGVFAAADTAKTFARLPSRIVALEEKLDIDGVIECNIREHDERLVHVEDDLSKGRECLGGLATLDERVDVFTAEVIDSLAPLDEFNLRLTALEAGSLGITTGKVDAVAKHPGTFVTEAQFKCDECDKRFDNITDAGRHVCEPAKPKSPGTIFRCECGERVCDPGKVCPECKKAVTKSPPKIVSVNHPRFEAGTVFSCEECGARSNDPSFVDQHDCNGCVQCARKLRDDGLCPVCDGDAIVEKLSLTCVECECPVDFDDEGGLCRNPSCPVYLSEQPADEPDHYAEALDELGDEHDSDRAMYLAQDLEAEHARVEEIAETLDDGSRCVRCGAMYHLTADGKFCADSEGCLARQARNKTKAEREADARVERDHVIEKLAEKRWADAVGDAETKVFDANHKIERLTAERDELQRDVEAEHEGSRSLRRDYGARANETMRGFVARLRRERDEAVDGEPVEETASSQREGRLMSLGREAERRDVLNVIDEQVKEFTATLDDDDNRDKVDALVGIPILEGVRATVEKGSR